MCRLYENGKELSAKSIIIKQDEMTAGQTAEADRASQDFLNNVENKEFEVFPNPAKDYITLKYVVLAQNLTITIVDNSGKVLKTEFLDNNSSQKTISVSDLSQGIYFVNLISNNKIISSKSVVIE